MWTYSDSAKGNDTFLPTKKNYLRKSWWVLVWKFLQVIVSLKKINPKLYKESKVIIHCKLFLNILLWKLYFGLRFFFFHVVTGVEGHCCLCSCSASAARWNPSGIKKFSTVKKCRIRKAVRKGNIKHSAFLPEAVLSLFQGLCASTR